MTVIFNTNSFSKIFDKTSAPIDVNLVDECIESTKMFDDCSPFLYSVYTLIGSFFTVEKVNIKKIGKSNDDIREISDSYLVRKNSMPLYKETLSEYLKKNIAGIDIDYDTFASIKTSVDVLSVTTDLFVIQSCIDMLECTKKNLEERKIEKVSTALSVSSAISHPDKEEQELRNDWEKTCAKSACSNKYCCLNQRTIRKISYAACMLRSGSRNYGSKVEIKHLSWVEKLIGVLKGAIVLINKQVHVPASPPKNNLVMLTV